MVVMKKRKRSEFSITKVVKANARERVGQPKPVKVIARETQADRAKKHKASLNDILHQEGE
jgi:hypothetical protein